MPLLDLDQLALMLIATVAGGQACALAQVCKAAHYTLSKTKDKAWRSFVIKHRPESASLTGFVVGSWRALAMLVCSADLRGIVTPGHPLEPPTHSLGSPVRTPVRVACTVPTSHPQGLGRVQSADRLGKPM